MLILESIIGLVGTIAFGTALYNSYRISDSFKKDSELAATKIFLNNSIVKSLRWMAFAGILFGLTGVISIYGISLGDEVLSQVIRAGSIILFITYSYLFMMSCRVLEKES